MGLSCRFHTHPKNHVLQCVFYIYAAKAETWDNQLYHILSNKFCHKNVSQTYCSIYIHTLKTNMTKGQPPFEIVRYIFLHGYFFQGDVFFWGVYIWVFPKLEEPQNGCFIMENPIKMDDLEVPLFSETTI